MYDVQGFLHLIRIFLCNIYSLKPNFYIAKNGVCRSVPIFRIFDPKHRLWVLIKTALLRRFHSVPTINVLSKNIKNIKHFSIKFSIFTTEKNLCTLHGQVFVMLLLQKYMIFFCLNVAEISLFKIQ